MTSGTLYGIGVGPGDPELISVKATRILKTVDVVFTAASTKNAYSLAVEIGKPHIPEGTPVEKLDFPMSKSQTVKEKAWRQNAERVAAFLERGQDAAFLTLGDPLIYSTYGYVLASIKTGWPDLKIKTVPGITSYQAAAAATNQPLVEGEESLLIMSGVQGGQRFQKMADKPENVVFLKAYRNLDHICQSLEAAEMAENSVAVANCSRKNQRIYRDLKELALQDPNYWTLIIAKRKPHAP